jgi:hypothetical protein
MSSKLVSTINRFIDANLAAGRIVPVETTASAAIRRARCQADLELAQALVAQALAERLGAPTHHPHPESGVTGVSWARSAHIGTPGRGDVLDPARDAHFPAGKAQQAAATGPIGLGVDMGSGSASKAPESPVYKADPWLAGPATS